MKLLTAFFVRFRFVKNSALKRSTKYGFSCEIKDCKFDELGDRIAGVNANYQFDAKNFDIQSKGTGYVATVLCPDGRKSKSKCVCKIQRGQRRFHCANLAQPEEAKKC